MNATDAERRGSVLSYVDSIAIFIIVFLNAYIAAASENAANGALEALDALSSPVSVAVRDGEEVELKPGGASLPLTFDTREEWCALIEEARRREARGLRPQISGRAPSSP